MKKHRYELLSLHAKQLWPHLKYLPLPVTPRILGTSQLATTAGFSANMFTILAALGPDTPECGGKHHTNCSNQHEFIVTASMHIRASV